MLLTVRVFLALFVYRFLSVHYCREYAFSVPPNAKLSELSVQKIGGRPIGRREKKNTKTRGPPNAVADQPDNGHADLISAENRGWRAAIFGRITLLLGSALINYRLVIAARQSRQARGPAVTN